MGRASILNAVTLSVWIAFLSTAPSAQVIGQDLYEHEIKPLLRSKCFSCHGPLVQEAGLRLDTVAAMLSGGDSGPAVVPGELQSQLLRRVQAEDPDNRMPPAGEPVSARQLARLKLWIREGAEPPVNERPLPTPSQHWAFQPIQSIRDADTSSWEIDERLAGRLDTYVERKLRQHGLNLAAPASEVDLVRRMFLDLHGLLPSPIQLEQWTNRLRAAEDSAQKREVVSRLIDSLLSSPRFGERWAQHWLDVVRYADTHGFEVNTPRPNAWPYRDYVIQALNDDTPYDQFLREQLVGDAFGKDAATGFMVAAAALLPGQIGKDDASKRLARQDALDEIVVGTTATFLGLTVGCARCHDHKFDPISQEDYYRLQAYFAGVEYGDRPVQDEITKDRQEQARLIQPELDSLRRQIGALQPLADNVRTIVIDDEDSERVELLIEKNGHGTNPAGSHLGYRDETGSAQRVPNLSRGRYVWFDNRPDTDTFTWHPQAAGKFRIWISWGAHGSGVHTRDARYLLDLDGDLSTRQDQQLIATIDQYYPAYQDNGETAKKPLWSGLYFAGMHTITEYSRILLRGGESGTGITADVIVLQEADGPNLPQFRSPVSALHNVDRFAPVEARFVRFTSLATIDQNKHEPCIDELEIFSATESAQNVALTAAGISSSGNYSETGKHQLPHINDGRYGNDRSWISNQHGQGWVQIELAAPTKIDRVEWSRDRNGKFKDRLALEYRIEVSLDGHDWLQVASSADRFPNGTPFDLTRSLLYQAASHPTDQLPQLTAQLASLQSKQRELSEPMKVFAGVFKDPEPTHVLNRGDPEQPLERVEPSPPSLFVSAQQLDGSSNRGDQARRMELANWLCQPDNPLVARVMVNRIWQYHFKIGLVETPSDFGINGTAPSHPELLDWLASELISSGWSLKHIHRLIMNSAAYQQASRRATPLNSQRAQSVDADNRLLWRFPSRRLEAEAIRDCMLQVSDNLNLSMGGPGFDFFKSRGGLNGFPPKEEFSAAEMRRMIYAHKIRMEPVPVFGAFDCPDAGLPTPRRTQSTTAIQALNLFNSSFVIARANDLASRLNHDAEDPRSQVLRAFAIVLGRSPGTEEERVALRLVERHGLAPLCRALLNTNEFLFIP